MIKIAISNPILIALAMSNNFFGKLVSVKINALNKLDEKKSSFAYQTLIMANGTIKQTQADRFNFLDDEVITYIKHSILSVHDIAVSSGTSSLSLFRKLKGRIGAFCVSDKYYKCKYEPGFLLTRVFDDDDTLLCAYLLGFVYVNSLLSNWFFLSKYLFAFISKRPPKYFENVVLYDPKLLKKIDNNTIRNIDYDVFETKKQNEFNFVRCMNLLNLGYFSEIKIKQAVKNIKVSLMQEGYLLIGRTHPNGENHASLYVKQNDNFVLIKHFSDGYEGDHLVDQ